MNSPSPVPPAPPPAFQDDPSTTFLDPHASKIAPDDPRLQIARAAGRTLKKGPAIALVTSLLTALMGAGALALQPASGPKAVKTDTDPAASAGSPVLPESLQNPALASSNLAAPGAPSATERTSRPMAIPATAAGSPLDRQRQLRADEDEKALSGPILFDTRAAGSPPPLDTAAMPLGGLAAPAPSGSHSADDDPNRQQRKNDFLDTAEPSDALGSTLQHPSSPTEVMAGTIIPAVLLTAVNSDVPGPVIAQVRENVYDTVTGNTLLVPQGARLLANYDSMVSWGQTRILVCWRRLLFPNGDSLDLHCAPAADLKGAAGLTDQVDEHWVRLLAGAGISSLLSASATYAAGNQTSYALSVPQLFASNAAGSVNQTGQQIVRRDLQVQPTPASGAAISPAPGP